MTVPTPTMVPMVALMVPTTAPTMGLTMDLTNPMTVPATALTDPMDPTTARTASSMAPVPTRRLPTPGCRPGWPTSCAPLLLLPSASPTPTPPTWPPSPAPDLRQPPAPSSPPHLLPTPLVLTEATALRTLALLPTRPCRCPPG